MPLGFRPGTDAAEVCGAGFQQFATGGRLTIGRYANTRKFPCDQRTLGCNAQAGAAHRVARTNPMACGRRQGGSKTRHRLETLETCPQERDHRECRHERSENRQVGRHASSYAGGSPERAAFRSARRQAGMRSTLDLFSSHFELFSVQNESRSRYRSFENPRCGSSTARRTRGIAPPYKPVSGA